MILLNETTNITDNNRNNKHHR